MTAFQQSLFLAHLAKEVASELFVLWKYDVGIAVQNIALEAVAGTGLGVLTGIPDVCGTLPTLDTTTIKNF